MKYLTAFMLSLIVVGTANADPSRRKEIGQSPYNNVFGGPTPIYDRGGGSPDWHRHPRPAPLPPNQVWVPGHYEWVYQNVWVPDRWVQRWVPPVYDYRLVRGIVQRVVIQPGYYEKQLVPGYWDYRSVQVWVPGCWRRY